MIPFITTNKLSPINTVEIPLVSHHTHKMSYSCLGLFPNVSLKVKIKFACAKCEGKYIIREIIEFQTKNCSLQFIPYARCEKKKNLQKNESEKCIGWQLSVNNKSIGVLLMNRMMLIHGSYANGGRCFFPSISL